MGNTNKYIQEMTTKEKQKKTEQKITITMWSRRYNIVHKKKNKRKKKTMEQPSQSSTGK